MGQPQRTVDIRVELSDVCPECGSVNTVVTMKSRNAVYSRCFDCAHVWRHEQVTH